MSAACLIILVIYFMTRELYSLYLKKLSYFLTFQNYVEWMVYITATIFVVFVYINHCGCPSSWQWQVGIFSVLFGWLNLIFITSNIPGLSLYTMIFKEILHQFFNLAIFAILLIIAFSLVLFMMFHNPTPSAKVS